MKEFYIKINEVVNDTIILFENKIKEDLKINIEHSNALYYLFFDKEFEEKGMLEEVMFNNDYQIRTFDYIDRIKLNNIEVRCKKDPLMFFDSITFDNYNDLNGYPRYYYLCSKKFVKNIDKLLVTNYKELGFTNSKQNILVKKISNDFKIEINSKTSRLRYAIEHPADYYPPLISFEIQNVSCNLGIFKKLRNMTSFINSSELFNLFFYRFQEENKLMYKEPFAYFNKDTNEYILQHSPENIERFNKFILIFVELYGHYFKVFEQWIIQDLEPKIKGVL